MATDLVPIDATVDIIAPENIAFHYRVAGPFRRLPAFLIDAFVRGVVLMLLAYVTSFVGRFLGGAASAAWIIVWFVLDWFYGGFFEAYWNGQTPGKRLMRIRVLTIHGQPINGMQAVMRNVLRTVDLLPPVFPQLLLGPPMLPTMMVGLVVMAMNRRFQRLGDLVCGTMVVAEDPTWLAGMAPLEDPRVYALAGHLPADYRVSRSLAQALAMYVERRRYFSAPRRREVARHVAEPLLRQFGLPADTSYDLLLCAIYYRAFIADRGEDEAQLARALGRPHPELQPASPFAVASAANSRELAAPSPAGGPSRKRSGR